MYLYGFWAMTRPLIHMEAEAHVQVIWTMAEHYALIPKSLLRNDYDQSHC